LLQRTARYAAYFLAGTAGSWWRVFALGALFVVAESGFIAVDTWLAQWSSDTFAGRSTSWYMGVYVSARSLARSHD